MDRLALEDALCTGLFRLIVFVVIFLLIVASNSYGTPSSDRLAISSMLDNTLDMESFDEIAGLEGTRDFLPELSQRIKVYSASSSNRYPDPESMRIIGSEVSFTSPLAMDLAQLPVVRAEFTLSAWIRVDTGVQPGQTFSLIRKPLASNRAVSCWGWFHPATLRFGANDFHSLALQETWEEVVAAESDTPTELTHEAVVVANGTAQFYRNGQTLGPALPIPRAITDCDGTTELGEAGLAMSSVKVYARALLPNQVNEMFVSGQPLFEIATGSTLDDARRDRFGEVQYSLTQTGQDIDGAVASLDQARAISQAAARANMAGDAEALEDVFYPEDHSPPAVLPELTPASSLPPRAKAEWEATGALRNLSLAKTGRWVDSEEDAGGRYWSVIGDVPVHAHYPAILDSASIPKEVSLGQLPTFEAGTQHVTFSFWLKAVAPYKQFSTVFEFNGYEGLSPEEITAKDADPEWEGKFAEFHVMAFGNAFQVHKDSERYIQPVADFVMGKPIEGPMDEKYFVVRDVGELLPVPWRFFVFHFDMENGFFEGYWDGYLSTRRQFPKFSKPANEIFSNLWVHLRTRVWWNNEQSLGKVADLRVYPRQLSEEQMQVIHETSVWPDGFPKKQCASPKDPSFYDSGDPRGGVSWPVSQDPEGRNCAWYAAMVEEAPHVCSSAAAKNMCPMTCKKVRECHTGAAYRGEATSVPDVSAGGGEEGAGAEGKVYRIFDRIMHLTPDYAAGATTLICPSKSVDVAAVLAKCRENPQAGYEQPDEFFLFLMELSWWGQKRADIRDCDTLERHLDYNQCAWDDAWVEPFQQDFEESGGAFSVMFWAHSVSNSAGMPGEFWLSVNFFVELAAPRSLLSVYPPNPYEESLMRMNFAPDKERTEASNWYKADVKPIKSVKFTEDWVLYYFSAEPQDVPGFPMRYCVGVNALVDCRNGIRVVKPEEFLAAVEFTREVMISPLEFRPRALSRAEVQRIFYAKAPKMALTPGPNVNEKDRLAAFSSPVPKDPGDFDEQLLLAAPPLLFQQRAVLEPCQPRAMRNFFEAQHKLVLAAHCSIQGQCDELHADDPSKGFLCKSNKLVGEEDDVKHYGLVPSKLDGKIGFTDFLYTMADSEVIVRDGQVLPAREFLDGQTQQAVVLCLFHVPAMGETIVVELKMEVVGVRVVTSRKYTFYGFLGGDQREQARLAFGMLFAVCVLGLLGNAFLFLQLRSNIASWPIPGWKGFRYEVGEVVFDVFVLLLVITFSGVAMRMQLNSEDRAARVIEDFAAVPFADPEVLAQDKVSAFFVAMDNLRSNLANEDIILNCAFVLMILMLVRIIMATAVHPRTAVLIGTIIHGFGDLWHFAIMFLMVFFFFSLTATWMFSASWEAFADFQKSCLTQFYVLIGEMPDDFDRDPRLAIYISISVMVQFFLMLNFLLAIVVEGYMKVREDIEANETEKEVVHDIVLTVYNRAQGIYHGWPTPKQVVLMLKNQLFGHSISCQELRTAGVDFVAAKGFVARYFSQRALRAEVVNKYDMNYIIRSIQPSLANDSAESSMHFRSINSSPVLATSAAVPHVPPSPQCATSTSGRDVTRAGSSRDVTRSGSSQHRTRAKPKPSTNPGHLQSHSARNLPLLGLGGSVRWTSSESGGKGLGEEEEEEEAGMNALAMVMERVMTERMEAMAGLVAAKVMQKMSEEQRMRNLAAAGGPPLSEGERNLLVFAAGGSPTRRVSQSRAEVSSITAHGSMPQGLVFGDKQGWRREEEAREESERKAREEREASLERERKVREAREAIAAREAREGREAEQAAVRAQIEQSLAAKPRDSIQHGQDLPAESGVDSLGSGSGSWSGALRNGENGNPAASARAPQPETATPREHAVPRLAPTEPESEMMTIGDDDEGDDESSRSHFPPPMPMVAPVEWQA